MPQPSSSRLKPPSTSRIPAPSSPSAARTRTLSSTPRAKTPTKPKPAESGKVSTPTGAGTLSIKEAIALKRSEARKTQMSASGGGGSGGGGMNMGSLEDALPELTKKPQEEEDLLGRLPVRETIEQARSTGSLNLATRSLVCLPSALFEIHLGLTPDPLRSVPTEPELPVSETKVGRRGVDKPAWFEAQDLTSLKAWNNDIQEIQHEISLFGSLKTVDLHQNKLSSLPNTFADLTSLTVLDLSHNSLTSLPEKLFALPELTTLNLSHNKLTALPFNAPFIDSNGRPKANPQSSGGFFTPAVSHATTPLPRLINLDASHNKITASAIDERVPVSITKLNLSGNPLGPSTKLMRNLASLKRLKEALFEKCEIGDDSFSGDAFGSDAFPSLRLLDLSETQVTLDVVKSSLKNVNQELNFDFSTEGPPEGVMRVLVGKRVIKEAWEIELERRANARKAAASSLGGDWDEPAPLPAVKAAAAATPSRQKPEEKAKPAPAKPKEVVKEAWEIEAEQGLLTEGGRRRARAQAAAAAAAAQTQTESTSNSTSSTSGLSNPQYFTQNTQTLRLPASTPPAKGAGHARAFSVATPSALSSLADRTADIEVPTPTLPLSAIVAQPFANTLRVLILANRRMDKTFALPAFSANLGGFLPCLEELDLEGCNLADTVQVSTHTASSSGSTTPPRTTEFIIPLLTTLFPSLRTLNLSYNLLTNASLTPPSLSELIMVSSDSPHRKGLRHLRMRGNRFTELDGFLEITELFKGNRQVPEWKLEELDVRDNEITKLPPELGLLPLDVFLVDGNSFRVPQRRVWEREGTKGLLSWLRGRME
ncbi:L domain-like protein [Agrocybe pediades]|nr:L domain-like protein [Agrocybe pediades]